MRYMTVFGVLAALAGASPAQAPAPSPEKPTLTIETTGVYEKGIMMGKTLVTVVFTSTPGKPAKHTVPAPVHYVTEGVVVSNGTTVDVLSLAEAKARFKDMAGVKGLCTLDLDGETQSCRDDDSQAKCVPHKKPAYCARQ